MTKGIRSGSIGSLDLALESLRGRMCYAECRSCCLTGAMNRLWVVQLGVCEFRGRYSSSSYAECHSCCLTGAMNDYELFSSESVNSEVVCAMRNVAADTFTPPAAMSQLLSDWGHERFRVVQLGVVEFRGHMCYAECRGRYFTPPAAMWNVTAIVWLGPWTITSCSAWSLWIQRSYVLCRMSQQILYSSSSYAECHSCCLTGTMNDYKSRIMFGAPGPSSVLQARVNTV